MASTGTTSTSSHGASVTSSTATPAPRDSDANSISSSDGLPNALLSAWRQVVLGAISGIATATSTLLTSQWATAAAATIAIPSQPYGSPGCGAGDAATSSAPPAVEPRTTVAAENTHRCGRIRCPIR